MKRTPYFHFSVFTIYILLLSAGLFPQMLTAQGWIQNFGIPGHNWQGEDVEKLPDGGYIIGGETESFRNVLIARLNQDGDTIWTKSFPGTNPWSDISLQDMETDAEGTTHAVLFNFDGWWASYVRIDLAGNVTAGFLIYPTETDDYLVSLHVEDDGIVFCGATGGMDSTVLLKKSFDVDLIWTRSLPTRGGALEMQQDADGNFILLIEDDDYHLKIVKTDPNGHFLWKVSPPGSLFRGSIAVQPDGRIVFASDNGIGNTIQLLHLSPGGEIINVVQDHVFTAKVKPVERIISDAQGNLFLTGAVCIVPGEDDELLLVKYDPDLVRLGYHSYDEGETFWIGKDLEITDDNSLIVCGTRVLSSAVSGIDTNLITVFKLSIESVTCIEEAASGENCRVQPNPFSDYLLFTLEKAGPGPKTIHLYSQEGKLLRREVFYELQYRMPVGELPGGILFYEISENGRLLASGRLVRK